MGARTANVLLTALFAVAIQTEIVRTIASERCGTQIGQKAKYLCLRARWM